MAAPIISLELNEILDAGASALGKALKVNSTLTELECVRQLEHRFGGPAIPCTRVRRDHASVRGLAIMLCVLPRRSALLPQSRSRACTDFPWRWDPEPGPRALKGVMGMPS